jgi:purine-binding chemotaxis protein CheW
LEHVREIVRAQAPTPVPDAPPFVEGVIDLRGVVVPVVDLRRRLGLPAAPLSRASRLLIASVGGRIVALLVDRALDVVRLARSAIRPAPPWLTPTEPRALVGVFRRDDPVLVLDLERLLPVDAPAPAPAPE